MMITRIIRKLKKLTGRFRKRDRIFLLSHMRANTSLFGHLLGSNPEVEGYYELHESYTVPEDLRRVKNKYYRSHPPKHGARYLFDKILHSNHEFDPDLVGPDDKVIFMIREPAPSVASILKIFSDKPDSRWSSREEAEDYYVERLEELARLSGSLKQRYLFLTSEELVGQSSSSLQKLTSFLGLKRPLTEHYQTFEKTGKRGFGDSSNAISSGKIVIDKESQGQAEEVGEACQQVYRDTLSVLKQNAR